MNVIVIGANGQIGQHVVNELHQSNTHTVTAVVRKKSKRKSLWIAISKQ